VDFTSSPAMGEDQCQTLPPNIVSFCYKTGSNKMSASSTNPKKNPREQLDMTLQRN
jgi:hypothetical protein